MPSPPSKTAGLFAVGLLALGATSGCTSAGSDSDTPNSPIQKAKPAAACEKPGKATALKPSAPIPTGGIRTVKFAVPGDSDTWVEVASNEVVVTTALDVKGSRPRPKCISVSLNGDRVSGPSSVGELQGGHELFKTVECPGTDTIISFVAGTQDGKYYVGSTVVVDGCKLSNYTSDNSGTALGTPAGIASKEAAKGLV